MNRPVPVWLVAVAATALALAVWVLAVPVAGVDLEAGTPPQAVEAVAVAVTTLVVTLAAWGVRTVLRRRAPVAWWVICAVVLVVSLLGPLGGTSPAAVGTLVALHLVVGTTVAVGLDPRRTRATTAVPAR
ncbi:DUF6069 family protein [Cellulomonas xylanilytica]|uniref:Uncharacterized protein n=1 Tax=Cellulomonas xylanilytica TaxID=233583 RepID=A0A510V7V0_9CELL|nr:DUF6069 family protein [Cellulomonas xylanilytica]GEK22041.1 hypothetical protein CXY01_25610 [Cellulomonas xylanilytica]